MTVPVTISKAVSEMIRTGAENNRLRKENQTLRESLTKYQINSAVSFLEAKCDVIFDSPIEERYYAQIIGLARSKGWGQ